MISYAPTLVDLTSNFFVLCKNMKVNELFIVGGDSHEYSRGKRFNGQLFFDKILIVNQKCYYNLPNSVFKADLSLIQK